MILQEVVCNVIVHDGPSVLQQVVHPVKTGIFEIRSDLADNTGLVD
jgi:hypothetical protein